MALVDIQGIWWAKEAWLRTETLLDLLNAFREGDTSKKQTLCLKTLISQCFSPFGLLLQNTTDWVAYKTTEILFLTVLEAGVWDQLPTQSGEHFFPNQRFLTMSSHGRRNQDSLGSWYRGTNPVYERVYFPELKTSQSTYLLTGHPWGLGFQHMHFEGTQTLSLKYVSV